MVRGFVESGASIERIWHVDIPYSTDTEVNSIITRELGRAKQCLPLFSDPLADYAAAQMLQTAHILRQIASSGPRRLLVVDDGAYFLRTLLMLSAIGDPAASRLRGACVVEQTTRGHRFLESRRVEIVAHGIRAVSVARTRTKLEFEAPFVEATVASALMRNRANYPWADVLILGYGGSRQSLRPRAAAATTGQQDHRCGSPRLQIRSCRRAAWSQPLLRDAAIWRL
jgi:hypothetical protein